MARLAGALDQLRDELDAAYPSRSKRSDGWIGDAKHAARRSDHNPNAAGVVCALDVTHDPTGGPDGSELAELLRRRAVAGDERIAYVIHDRRITSARRGWRWDPYRGSNPHTTHVHVSVVQSPTLYDDRDPYGIANVQGDGWPILRLTRPATKSVDVVELQRLLREHGHDLAADGVFGPKTKAAVIAYQTAAGLKADGIVGPTTWESLGMRLG